MGCYQCGGEGGTEVILCPACREQRIRQRSEHGSFQPGPNRQAVEDSDNDSAPGFSIFNYIDPSFLAGIISLLLFGAMFFYLKPFLMGEHLLKQLSPDPGNTVPQRQSPAVKQGKDCTDSCGNGTCDVRKVVGGPICIGDACPCFETAQSCPADCSAAKCVSRCGDGKCARHPCLGAGCSCKEDHDSCPQDCCKQEFINGRLIIRGGCFDEWPD